MQCNGCMPFVEEAHVCQSLVNVALSNKVL